MALQPVTSWSLLPPEPSDTPPKCNGVWTQAEGAQPQTISAVECPESILQSLRATTPPTPTSGSNGNNMTPTSLTLDVISTATSIAGSPNGANPKGPHSSAAASQTSPTISASGVVSTSDPPGAVKQTKGLAGGPVAGVAVGMLLAGFLLAGVVFLYLLRRQKRQQAMAAAAYSRQNLQYTGRKPGLEKGATVVATAVSSIDDLLPQPVEDDALTGDLSKIRDNIKNHVRTFYHSDSISTADVNEAGVQHTAALMNASGAVLSNALLEPSKRDNALRSILAAVILVRCTGDKSPDLLPRELSALATTMSMENNGNANNLVLFSKWKTITGALLQQRYGKKHQDHAHTHDFQDVITALDAVLAPFVKGSIDGGQRRKNLDMILTRAANFAFMLFAQPGSFQFDFGSPRGGLTVFPALIQIVGDQGQPLSPVKVLTQREGVPV